MNNLSIVILLGSLLLPFCSKGQQEVRLAVQTGHSSTVLQLAFSKDGRKLASAGADNKVVVWDISKHKQIQILSGHSTTVTAVDFHPTQPLIATASIDGQVYIKSLINGENVWTYKLNPSEGIGLQFNAEGDQLIVAGERLVLFSWESGQEESSLLKNLKYVCFNSANSRFAAIRNNGNVIIGEVESLSIIKRYKGNFDKVSFSNSDTFIYAAGNNGILKRWNLQGSNIWQGMTITANRFWDSYYDVAVNDQHFIGANRDKMIYVRNHESGKLQSVLKAHGNEVMALAISPDGQLLASAGVDSRVLLWSIESGKLVSELRGVSNRINDVIYGASGRSLAIAYDNGSVRATSVDEKMSSKTARLELGFMERLKKYELSIQSISNYQEDTLVEFIAIKKIRSKKSDSKYKKYQQASGVWDIQAGDITLRKWAKINPSDQSLNIHNYNSDAVTLSDDKVSIEGILFIPNHSDRLTAIARNPVYSQFATSSWDGMIKIWNLGNQTLALNYSAMAESDFIMTDPNSYYYATKGALRGVGFFVRGEVLAFDQFDTKYNRPDLVFAELPYIDKTLINNYELAYNKRLSKLKVSLGDLDYSDEIPQLRIINDDLKYVVKARDYSLEILGTAKEVPLKKFQILINGVPTYGSGGLQLDSPYEFTKEVKLRLNPGRNEIAVYTTNAKGVSSYREVVKVDCQVKIPDPDLYLVTIGGSKYEMDEYNLTYAAKDAEDIASSFRRNKYFKQTHILELVNEDVNRASLERIQSFILPSKPEDVVIISVAGHGVLSQDMDYYLSTYDMDFNNPETKGIAYEDLEAVLDRTESRQKTLILDACHSGEVDKEELMLTAGSVKVESNVTFRSVGADVSYKEQNGLKSSFELSKQLFTDMRANNGATIISSAGAAEYAYEGKEWSNGLFTYVMLEGLKTNKADLNNDGMVMLSELQRYLFDEVPRLSGGLQTPTSRVENLSNDFRIK